jgi:hypothetical protein
MAFNFILVFFMTDHLHLKSGPLSAEGYYMFANLINKPWGKVASYGLGVLLAFTYIDILDYRKMITDEQKQKQFPRLYILHTKPWISHLGQLLCLGVIPFTLFISHSANKDPYSWPQWLNDVYYTFNKFLFMMAVTFLMLTVFLGHGNLFKVILKNTYTRAGGKICFEAALVTPVLITLLYFG